VNAAGLVEAPTPTPRNAPGTYPVPAGRGRWRLTLHARNFFGGPFTAAPTWQQTILVELVEARSRKLDQQWNTPAQLTFSLDGHDPAAAQVVEMSTEVYAWRWDDTQGVDVPLFRGCVTQGQDDLTEQSHTVTFTALDYAALMDRRIMVATTPTVWTQNDQDGMAWSLVNTAAQGSPPSRLPLLAAMVNPDGSARAAASGTLRDRSYAGSSFYGTLFAELARALGGFDWDVVPEPRAYGLPQMVGSIPAGMDAVRIFFPSQGVTRADVPLVYGSNVATVQRIVTSTNYANWIRALGNNASSDPNAAQLVVDVQNADATGTAVGLWQQVENAADVTLSGTLADQANGALTELGAMLPTYTLGLRPGAYTYGAPNIGDTCPLYIKSGRLDVAAAIRVVGLSYAIGDDGDEDVTLTVGALPTHLGLLLRRSEREIRALNRK
jgi:hypothetical protein